MGEEEDKSSISRDSSNGSISRAGQPRHSQSNESSSQQGPRRTRPGRAQRQRRREAADNSAPTTDPSNLNPSAPNFVPRQGVPARVARMETSTTNDRGANRTRPRGGRRGRHGKEKEKADETSHAPPFRPPQQPRKNDNVKFRVQPKIIKESEDLLLRMTEALSKGEYDCSICTDSVSQLDENLFTVGSTMETGMVL